LQPGMPELSGCQTKAVDRATVTAARGDLCLDQFIA